MTADQTQFLPAGRKLGHTASTRGLGSRRCRHCAGRATGIYQECGLWGRASVPLFLFFDPSSPIHNRPSPRLCSGRPQLAAEDVAMASESGVQMNVGAPVVPAGYTPAPPTSSAPSMPTRPVPSSSEPPSAAPPPPPPMPSDQMYGVVEDVEQEQDDYGLWR